MNAPMTPEIAPLAPIVGTFEPKVKACVSTAEPTPQIK